METLALWTGKALTFILAAFAAGVVYKLLTGGIRLRGLLLDTEPRATFSPARVQLLVFTLAAAGEYLKLLMQRPEHSGLPAPPDSVLQVLGASQVLYAGCKGWQRLLLPSLQRLMKGNRP